jgi:hypothetical protein
MTTAATDRHTAQNSLFSPPRVPAIGAERTPIGRAGAYASHLFAPMEAVRAHHDPRRFDHADQFEPGRPRYTERVRHLLARSNPTGMISPAAMVITATTTSVRYNRPPPSRGRPRFCLLHVRMAISLSSLMSVSSCQCHL